MRLRDLPPPALHGLALLAAAVTHLVLWRASYAVFSASIDFNTGALEDFLGPYYETARSGAPAPGFLYTPFFALLLRPLGALGPRAASWTWLAIELAASAALVVLAARAVRPRRGLSALHTYVALTSYPLLHNLHWGQVSVLLAVAVVAGIGADLSRQRRLAAMLFGVAAAVKGYPALFLVVLLLSGALRAALLGAGVALVLAGVVPMAAFGVQGTIEFWEAVLTRLGGVEPLWADAPAKQFFGAVVARWLHLDGVPARAACTVAGLAWGAANLVVARRRLARGDRAGRLDAYVLVALSVPLVVSPAWPHYLVLLPFCQVSLAASRPRESVALVCVVLSVVLASAPFFRLHADPVDYGRAGWLLAAHLLLLVAAYRCPGRTEARQN